MRSRTNWRYRCAIITLVTTTSPRKRPLIYAAFLIVAGLIGLFAAWQLTLDKFFLLENPDAQLGCDVNILVGCSKNLQSAAGAVFGVPNPMIGLVCWPIVIALGVGLIAGARFARWYWFIFMLGTWGAMALVIFFITASVTFVGSLCPWCMVTWTVTIPTFWATTFYVAKTGALPLPKSLRRVAATLYSWVPLITVISYAIVAIVAQLQVDWLRFAFA